MSTNKKSIASQALLEMDDITKILQAESKKTLGTMLNEAIKNAIREGCNEEEDDYEVIDNGKKDSAGNKKKSPKKKEDEAGSPEEMMQQSGGQQQMQQPQGTNPQLNGQQGQAAEGPEMGQDMGQGMEQGMGQDMGQDMYQDMSNEMPQQGGGEGDEGWDEFSDYRVGDTNTFDLTGVKDYNQVVKVYKLLNDEDQVVVQKDGNTLQLKDNNAGTEYVIDLGGDDDEESQEQMPEDMEGEENPEGLNESFDDDMAGFPDDDEYEDDDFGGNDFEDDDFGGNDFEDDDFGGNDFEDDDFGGNDFEDDNFDDGGYFDENEYGNDNEFGGFEDDDFGGSNSEEDDEMLYEIRSRRNKNNKKERKPMRESKSQVLFEVDLGYTDNYQDKDPIAGLSNDEPSKGKKSWHKGVPTGTSKPWAGDSKGKGDPFKKTQKVNGSVNEGGEIPTGMEGDLEEQTNVGGFVQQNSVTTSHVPTSNGRNARSRRGGKGPTTSSESRYPGNVNESKELKAIKNENKELKRAIVELRKSLNEACVTNVNLGKITKLFLENATTQKEKIEIVNRFANEAKSVEQSKMLYETIDRELKKGNKQQLSLNESSVTANGTKSLNEQTVYKSKDLMETIDLINRVNEY